MSNEIVEIPYDEIVHETTMAWLITIDGDEVWIPMSICKLNEQNREIEMPEWLAIEKGLI